MENEKTNEQLIADSIKDGLSPFLDEIKKLTAAAKANPVGIDAKEVMLNENKDYRASVFFQAAGRLLTGIHCIPENDMAVIKKIHDIESKTVDPMTEGTTTDGGYIVPTLTTASINELIPTYGQAFQYLNVIPMGGNPTNWPKENALATAYWPGEGVAITASKLTLDIDTLTPKKAAVIVPLSSELLTDANPSIGAYIVKKAAQAIGTSIDTKAFQNAATTFNGIFYASNTFGATVNLLGKVNASITYQSMIDCAYGIDQNYLSGAAWYMHRTIFAAVRGITDTNERPIYEPAYAGLPPSIFGYPVVLIEKAPTIAASTPIILLGNLQNSLLGDVAGLTVDLFNTGTVSSSSLLELDLVAFRVKKRVALAPAMTGAYSIIKTSA